MCRSSARLPIETPLGTHVPLGDVADIAIVPAPNEIKREGASRRIDVTCNVAAGARPGHAWPRRSRRRSSALEFEREYHPEFLGEYAAREESQPAAAGPGGPVAAGHPAAHPRRFPSWRLTLLVSLTLPFALVGGVVGAISAAACCRWARWSAS